MHVYKNCCHLSATQNKHMTFYHLFDNARLLLNQRSWLYMQSVVYYTDIKLKHCSMAKGLCIQYTEQQEYINTPLCNTQTYTYALTCIHIYVHTYIWAYMYVVCTCLCIYGHVYIHTCMHMLIVLQLYDLHVMQNKKV